MLPVVLILELEPYVFCQSQTGWFLSMSRSFSVLLSPGDDVSFMLYAEFS